MCYILLGMCSFENGISIGFEISELQPHKFRFDIGHREKAPAISASKLTSIPATTKRSALKAPSQSARTGPTLLTPATAAGSARPIGTTSRCPLSTTTAQSISFKIQAAPPLSFPSLGKSSILNASK